MKKLASPILVGWIAVALAATTIAQSPGLSAADSKELASYRLTMENVRKMQSAMRAMMEEAGKDPKYQAIIKLNAEIDALEKKEELTDAEAERLEALRQKKEEAEDAVDDGLNVNDADSLDEMEAQIKKFPPMVRALNAGGLSPREFSKMMMTMLMAGMVASFQKSGMLKELPKDLKEIHPDNVKFMMDHEAEIAAMTKEWQQMSKGIK
jgi:tellurite resistance protein